MGKRDLLPAYIRSVANFNVYPQFYRIEDRVTSLNDFCTASTERLLTQCLLRKYKSHSQKSGTFTLARVSGVLLGRTIERPLINTSKTD